MINVQKIVPNLWFDSRAEEAVKYYLGIFKNSKMGRITHYTKDGYEVHHKPEGTVLTIEFEIEGQRFVALNGGPEFRFSEAVSFIIQCETQNEIDYYWDRLSEGGDPNAQQCGWLKDKFGLSWQVTPRELFDMISDSDNERVSRVMAAYMPMKKFNLEELRQAYRGQKKLSNVE
jgi:predicted 3-demethylubiquinone-9 3-methyltransferase (glyoxalase superfamily)